MTVQYLGEIRLFTWAWAPKGWAQCDGSRLVIKDNAALYALIGSRYGPTDGVNYFTLPDLRGRVAVGAGSYGSLLYYQGITGVGGQESVTLDRSTMPAHTHTAVASDAVADRNPPSGNIYAVVTSPPDQRLYRADYREEDLIPLNSRAVTGSGGGFAHDNLQPSLVLNYCICTDGEWPPRP